MNIELKGDNFELSFKYKTSIIDRVRQIPGRRFDGAKKVWIVPTRSRVELERMIYQIQQFENINWVTTGSNRSAQFKDSALSLST